VIEDHDGGGGRPCEYLGDVCVDDVELDEDLARYLM
jgi:hypothetical protein